MLRELAKLRVFVGLRLRSEFHDIEDMKSLMNTLSNNLRKSDRISLDVQYGKFPPGSILWDEITNAISRSDICIFDISENNPNVMMEVGLALGLGKQVFMLKNKKSEKQYPKPSDVPSVYVPYEGNRQLNSANTLEELTIGFKNYMEKTHKSEYLFKSIWGFDDNDSITVICSELDKPEMRMYPEKNEFIYLSKYGDVDTLVEVIITLNKLYPNAEVLHHTGEEVKQGRVPYTGNIVLIGGPDYNAATRLFEELVPYEYKCGKGGPNDIYLHDRETNETYYPEFREEAGHQKVKDFGFFAKVRNPHNPDNKLVLIGGSHTYGVYGAAKAFSYEGETKEGIQYQNCKLVTNAVGYGQEFCTIFEVHGADQTIDIPRVNLKRLRSMKSTKPSF